MSAAMGPIQQTVLNDANKMSARKPTSKSEEGMSLGGVTHLAACAWVYRVHFNVRNSAAYSSFLPSRSQPHPTETATCFPAPPLPKTMTGSRSRRSRITLTVVRKRIDNWIHSMIYQWLLKRIVGSMVPAWTRSPAQRSLWELCWKGETDFHWNGLSARQSSG